MDDDSHGADRPRSSGGPATSIRRASGANRATATATAAAMAVFVVVGIRLADPGTAEELPAAAPIAAASPEPVAQQGPLALPQTREQPATRPGPAASSPRSGGAAGHAATPRPDRPTRTAPAATAAPPPTATAAPTRPADQELLPTWRGPVPLPRESRPVTGPAAGANPIAATRPATAAEQVGVVDIVTVLDFGAGAAAGTGIVLPSGEILTNNHVIRDATQITVTAVTTGASSTASVVGTDPSDDIAVLRLSGGSAGTPAVLAGAPGVAVGDAVVAVGNAGGVGGVPTAAPGTVLALDKDITASESGTAAHVEQLEGLIEFAAAIQPGDSGGPLYAKGAVIGIDTAGSTARLGRATLGYAIPISAATAIAGRILAGEQSSTIHQGVPAFLGAEIDGRRRAGGGARISVVVAASPAAVAGLTAGSTITAFGGTAVDAPATLAALLTGRRPQDQVTVTWTDTAGDAHTATITLGAGPAD